METLAKELNFVLTVTELEAVGVRVEVLVQVEALQVVQISQSFLARLG